MTDIFDGDVAAVETELPVTFKFKSRDYVGQKNETTDAFDMDDPGQIQKYDFELSARAVIFTDSTPAKNDSFIIAGISYRVQKIKPSQDGVMLNFGMVQDN